MSDCKQEQLDELDALRAIYPDEFEEDTETKFRILITHDLEDVDENCELALCVEYPENYPEEALPTLKLECVEGELTDTEFAALDERLRKSAEENFGMAMVFTLASATKEDLNELIMARKEEKDRLYLEKQAAAVEAENARFRGTKVTTENFLAWKSAFEKETRDAALSDKAARKAEEAKRNKITGRALFEKDKSLAQSDANFVEEGDVTVDVSLFERRLDLGESDDEEEDREEDMVAANLFRNKDD